MTLRDRFGLTPEDLEDLIADQEQELDRLRAEIEHRDRGYQAATAGRCTARYGSARCVLLEGHVEDHRLTWRGENEIERRDGPGGNPPETGQSGISVQEPCPNGLSECLICPRCGREMRSLEQIRAKLDLAPTLAEEVATKHRADGLEREICQRRYLCGVLAEVSRDLACHDHACKEEPL